MTTAINMFLRTAVREKGQNLARDHSTKGYVNIDDLKNALEEWLIK